MNRLVEKFLDHHRRHFDAQNESTKPFWLCAGGGGFDANTAAIVLLLLYDNVCRLPMSRIADRPGTVGEWFESNRLSPPFALASARTGNPELLNRVKTTFPVTKNGTVNLTGGRGILVVDKDPTKSYQSRYFEPSAAVLIANAELTHNLMIPVYLIWHASGLSDLSLPENTAVTVVDAGGDAVIFTPMMNRGFWRNKGTTGTRYPQDVNPNLDPNNDDAIHKSLVATGGDYATLKMFERANVRTDLFIVAPGIDMVIPGATEDDREWMFDAVAYIQHNSGCRVSAGELPVLPKSEVFDRWIRSVLLHPDWTTAENMKDLETAGAQKSKTALFFWPALVGKRKDIFVPACMNWEATAGGEKQDATYPWREQYGQVMLVENFTQ